MSIKDTITSTRLRITIIPSKKLKIDPIIKKITLWLSDTYLFKSF